MSRTSVSGPRSRAGARRAPGGTGRRERSCLVLRLTTAAVAVAAITAPASAARADAMVQHPPSGEVGALAETVYRPDPEAGVARVEVTFQLTNDGPLAVGDFVTQLPRAAAAASASTPGGVPLAVRADAGGDDATIAHRVTLSEPLAPRHSTSVVVHLELPSGPPRSDADVVVNDAAVAIRPMVFGDPGSSLVVVLPDGFTAAPGGELDLREDPSGATMLVADDVADPRSFSSVAVADRPEHLQRTTYDAPSSAEAGATFEVRSWPGDEEWAALVVEELEFAVPALEAVVGRPWPNRGTTAISQQANAALRGYDGSYRFDVDEIELAADFPRQVFVHELAHAWFDRAAFQDRWVREGLAELAAELTRSDPDAIAASTEPPPVDPAARTPLLDWKPGPLATGTERRRALDAYRTSLWVLNEITREIGIERLRAVVGGALAQVPAVGWREFLDELEDVGGSRRAVELFRTYVVDDDAAVELAWRARAHERVDRFVAAVGAAAVPEIVYDHIRSWRFADAIATMDDLEARSAAVSAGAPPLVPTGTFALDRVASPATRSGGTTDLAPLVRVLAVLVTAGGLAALAVVGRRRLDRAGPGRGT